MKFLLWSSTGHALPLADRLQSEGNDVQVYIHEPAFKDQYTGIMKKLDNFSKGLEKDTIVIFDMVGNGKIADNLKGTHRVVGGGAFNDKLELKRDFGLLTMKRAGIDTGQIHRFDGLRSAMSFVRERDPEERWVLKPLNNMPTSIICVPPDRDHLVMHINYLIEERIIPINTPVILQEFFDGIEVSTEMWLTKGRPVYGLANHTFEIKHLLPGDLGSKAGCMASTVWSIPGEEDPMVKNLFTSKLLRILESEEYTGPLDINSIVTHDALMPYGLEFTPRFGYSALWAFLELWDGEAGRLMADIASGDRPKEFLKSGFGHAVRVSVPPFPYVHPDKQITRAIYKKLSGLPVGVIPDFQHTWLLDVKRNKQLEYVVAGTDGVVMEVSGYGDTIEVARDTAKKILDQLTLPDKQYRNDSADRAIREFPLLKKIKEGLEGAKGSSSSTDYPAVSPPRTSIS